MTDIEKKAREYAVNIFHHVFFCEEKTWGEIQKEFEQAFLAGASYALGNQWRDAEKEKPKDEQKVLILTTYIGAKSGEHRMLVEWFTYFEQYGFWLKEKSEQHLKLKVLAWMEIPEYKPKGE